jgi:hypothetical protein
MSDDYPSIWKDEVPTSTPPSIWKDEVSQSAGETYGPLPATAVFAPAPVAVHEDRAIAGVPVALAVGAVVAFLGGLLWAWAVILSHYDIGILAWLIGAATGFAVVSIAGGPVDASARALSGLFAATGIMIGKYVIFVHQLRKAFHDFLALTGITGGPRIGYLDGNTRHVFFSNFGSAVKPIYILWVALAFFAAHRTAGGGRLFGRRPYQR